MTSDGSQLSSGAIPPPATDGQPRTRGFIRPVSGVMRVARRSVTAARRSAATIVARVPGTFEATRVGAHEATSALQTLPDPTLRSLAASSVGLGAGFYLAGAPRLVIVAGVVPAMLMSAAIILRPIAPLIPSGADR